MKHVPNNSHQKTSEISEARLSISNGVNNIKHILKKGKGQEGLSPRERALLKSKLNEYRAYTPLRDERAAEYTRLPIVKPQRGFSLLLNTKPMPLIAGLLIAASVSGGTAFAAEGALPGDILYPIKTEVNENVRSAFALDAEAKAQVDAWRAERRLDETQKLAARGELSNEMRATLAAQFENHAARAEERIAMIETNDPALALELSTKFEASVAARIAILDGTSATASTDINANARGTIAAFAQNDSAALSAEARSIGVSALTVLPEEKTADEARPELDNPSTAKRMYVAAEKTLKTTRELYAKVEGQLDETTKVRVEAHIKNSAATFAEGERQYAAEIYTEAFLSFKSVVRSLGYLNVFLRAQINGTIDINIAPLPLIEPLPPVLIDLSSDTTTPAPAPRPIQRDDGAGAQIDPPSLELDAGPEDTSTDTKTDVEIDTRTRLEVNI